MSESSDARPGSQANEPSQPRG
ncbi:MAG: hypothetical protein RLZZ459_499, partial [Cyanobacteriota bacterium]